MSPAMDLAKLGEDRLIERIQRIVRTVQGTVRWVPLGIGDDGALVRVPNKHELVVSTDASVEGTHFRLDWMTSALVGRRAVTAAASDLAAMGARPLALTLALGARPDFSLAAFDALIKGIAKAADRYSLPLVGGNLARASKLNLSLTVMGCVPRGTAMQRKGARVADELFVTGELGRSALALAKAKLGHGIRYCPTARLEAGTALRKLRGVGACMDLSDGLSVDLARLLRVNELGAEVFSEALPSSAWFSKAMCQARFGSSAIALARRRRL